MYSTNLSVFLYLTRKAVMELITLFLTEWGYLALFVLMALENMNIPIPSEIILGFAGFLVYKQIFSFIPTIIIGTIAGIVGSLLSYWLGYKGGRAILLKYSTTQNLTTKKLVAANSWFQKYGGIAVFTGRLLPGIRTFISLPAGIARYDLSKFIILSLFGTIPWTLFLVYLGVMLGENWHILLNWKLEILIASILLVLFIFIVFYLFKKK